MKLTAVLSIVLGVVVFVVYMIQDDSVLEDKAKEYVANYTEEADETTAAATEIVVEAEDEEATPEETTEESAATETAEDVTPEEVVEDVTEAEATEAETVETVDEASETTVA